MKKILLKVMAVVMVIMLLSGCGEKPSESPDAEASPDPTPSSTPIEQKSFSAEDYIKNKVLWDTPVLRENGFLFEIQCGGENVVRDGLGDPHEIFSSWGPERWAKAEEWGNFILNCDGIEWFTGDILETHFSGDEAPKTREEAVQKIFDFLNTVYKPLSSTGIYYAMNSICPWQHYAAEAGFNVIGVEFAESYNYQLRLAMARGAARQYQTPWYVDFSSWYGGMLDYREDQPYGTNPDGTPVGGPNNGHSLNLQERSFIYAYMAGADAMVAEGGGPLCYYEKEKEYIVNGENCYTAVYEGQNISPYGELCKKFYSFAKSNPDVGTSYAPYAVVLDKYHGMDGYPGQDHQAFGNFWYEDGDNFTQQILSKIWNTYDKPNHVEQTNLVNNKYGELFDMVLQNVSAELCDTYKALILTGNLELSDDEVQKYINYVKNGGCLVINTAYVDLFSSVNLPDTVTAGKHFDEIEYGEGSFIVFGQGGTFETCMREDGSESFALGADYSASGFDHVMEVLQARFVPFEISEEVMYSINVKDNTLYLTLINNNGITKNGYSAVVVDESKAVDLQIKLIQNYCVESVSDIYNSTPLQFDNQTVSLTLPAGGVAVLEFKLK